MILLDALFVLGEDLLHGAQKSRLRQFDIAFGCQSQRDLVPNEVGSGNLFKKARGRLENNGVRKDDHSPRRLDIVAAAAHFHQMQSYETDIEYIAGDAGDLHAIPDPDAILADQEEISGNGHNYVLQSNSYARRDESGKHGKRTNFSSQSERNRYSNDEPQDNAAQ